MDRETERRLAHIGQSIPKELLQRGIIHERPFGEVKDKLERMKRDPSLSRSQRDAAARVLENPKLRSSLDRVDTRIDPKVAQEIDRHVSERVNAEIRSGRIKKPGRDPFHNFVDSHMKGNLKGHDTKRIHFKK